LGDELVVLDDAALLLAHIEELLELHAQEPSASQCKSSIHDTSRDSPRPVNPSNQSVKTNLAGGEGLGEVGKSVSELLGIHVARLLPVELEEGVTNVLLAVGLYAHQDQLKHTNQKKECSRALWSIVRGKKQKRSINGNVGAKVRWRARAGGTEKVTQSGKRPWPRAKHKHSKHVKES